MTEGQITFESSVDRHAYAGLVAAGEGVAAPGDSPPSIVLQAEPGKCCVRHVSPG